MLATARYAINDRLARSQSSGFHHAGYAYCEAFCTFNGPMVTALKLIGDKAVDSVGILDCDAHYGRWTSGHHFNAGAPRSAPPC